MSQLSETLTLKELKMHPNYKEISGRSSMNKEELYKELYKMESKLSKNISPKSKVKSPKTILTTLPKEIHHKILLDMEPQALINACTTDKRALSICTDDQFWKTYYETRGLKFKPYNYPYVDRIMEARIQLLHAMSIDELKEAVKDKMSLKICQEVNFWKKYWRDHGLFNFHEKKYKKCQERFKEFEIEQWVDKMGAGYSTKMQAKICGDHITLLSNFLPSKVKKDIQQLELKNNCLYVLINVVEPDYFKFNIYSQSRKTGVSFDEDFDFLFNIYDLMSDKKIIGK